LFIVERGVDQPPNDKWIRGKLTVDYGQQIVDGDPLRLERGVRVPLSIIGFLIRIL
jgi:hypothetical protein